MSKRSGGSKRKATKSRGRPVEKSQEAWRFGDAMKSSAEVEKQRRLLATARRLTKLHQQR